MLEETIVEFYKKYKPKQLKKIINYRDEENFHQTLMHYAAINQDSKSIILLALAYSKIDQIDDFGYSPIALAVINGNQKEVEVLYRLGSDIYRMYEGKTLWELAFMHKQDEIGAYIVSLFESPRKILIDLGHDFNLDDTMQKIDEYNLRSEEWALFVHEERLGLLGSRKKNTIKDTISQVSVFFLPLLFLSLLERNHK